MPRGESSKIVPTLIVNCFLQPLQNQMRRVEMKECSAEPQRGQLILPSGQRSMIANANARSASEKYTIASCRVFGSFSAGLSMHLLCINYLCVSSKLLP